MFYAISKTTNEKVNSLTIKENASYQFVNEETFYADPDEIESCPENIDINKIEVKFREGKMGIVNYNGTEYDVSPHFYIPNKTKLGINTIPESKEHKMAKNFIYNKIKNKELILNYSKINKPYKYHNQINLFDLPIDYEKIGIEVGTSRIGGIINRRADIIIPFIIKHPIFGNGVVIEIQFSNQKYKSKISRELDWAIRGYSISWLYKKDFEFISDLIIDLKNKEINVDSFAVLIKQNNKSFVRDLKYCVQEECRRLDNKKEEIKKDIHSYIKGNEGFINKYIQEELEKVKNNLQPRCPKCNSLMLLIKHNGDKFWGCGNYPYCKTSMAYIE